MDSAAAAAVAAAAAASASASASSTPPFSPDAYRASLLDVADVYGSNASHYACRAGEDGALSLLADAGACLELPSGPAGGASSGGSTGGGSGSGGLHPAHLAVAHGFLFCLEELASRGVDLEAEDGDGETPLSLAVQVRFCWSCWSRGVVRRAVLASVPCAEFCAEDTCSCSAERGSARLAVWVLSLRGGEEYRFSQSAAGAFFGLGT